MELLDTAGLHAKIARLAALRRESASPGELDAARIVAGELESAGVRAHLEHARVHGTFWWPLGMLAALGAACAFLGRLSGGLVGALAAAGMTDELWVGRRWFRRRLLRQRETTNVWGALGESGAPTLVVHAHHDAAHTGLVFHPLVISAPGRVAPDAVERAHATPPVSWAMVAAPALAAAGKLFGARALSRGGSAVCALIAALMADVGRSEVVPGANDNVTGVVALISLARALAAAPPRRLRVVLLSTGSEESPLEGMQAWMQRHSPPAETVFLCLDGLGSERLVVVDGEGMLKLHRYPAELRESVARCGRDVGLEVEPFSFRFATDGQVALRAGYRAAALSSIDWDGAPRNYHLPSDDVDHVEYGTLFDATKLVLELIRRMDR